MTALDTAHAAMDGADDEAARRSFWGLVAASELYLWLEVEARDDALSPQVFEIEGVRYALAFDTEDRLGAFAGGAAPYASLAGRRLAGLLAQQNLGFGLNLGSPSEMLAPPDLVAWLAEMTQVASRTASGRPVGLSPPTLAQDLVEMVDRRLAAAEGLARRAWLATAEWEDGTTGHLLAVEETVPRAADAIARSVAEGLAFAGADVPLDVAGVTKGAPMVERLERVALRFDLPEPQRAEPRDPALPPRLR